MTGTPIQNDVAELFSLLAFIDPKKFPSRSDFLDKFAKVRKQENAQRHYSAVYYSLRANALGWLCQCQQHSIGYRSCRVRLQLPHLPSSLPSLPALLS